MKKISFVCVLVLVGTMLFAQAMRDTKEFKHSEYELDASCNIDGLMNAIQHYIEEQQSAHILIAAGATHHLYARFSSGVFFRNGWVWVVVDANVKDDKLIIDYSIASKKKSLDSLWSLSVKKQEKLDLINTCIKDIDKIVASLVQDFSNKTKTAESEVKTSE